MTFTFTPICVTYLQVIIDFEPKGEITIVNIYSVYSGPTVAQNIKSAKSEFTSNYEKIFYGLITETVPYDTKVTAYIHLYIAETTTVVVIFWFFILLKFLCFFLPSISVCQMGSLIIVEGTLQ